MSGGSKRHVFKDDRAPFILEVDDETDTDLLAVLNDWMSPKGFDFATIERLTNDAWSAGSHVGGGRAAATSSSPSTPSSLLLQGFGRQITILRRTRLLDRARGAAYMPGGGGANGVGGGLGGGVNGGGASGIGGGGLGQGLSTFGLSSSLNKLFQEAYTKICYTVRNMRPCHVLSLNHHINIIEDGQVEVLVTAMVHQVVAPLSGWSPNGPLIPMGQENTSRSSTPSFSATTTMNSSRDGVTSASTPIGMSSPILVGSAGNNNTTNTNANSTAIMSSSPNSHKFLSMFPGSSNLHPTGANGIGTSGSIGAASSSLMTTGNGLDGVLMPLFISDDDNLQVIPPALVSCPVAALSQVMAGSQPPTEPHQLQQWARYWQQQWRHQQQQSQQGVWVLPRMDVSYDVFQSTGASSHSLRSPFNFLNHSASSAAAAALGSSPGGGSLSLSATQRITHAAAPFLAQPSQSSRSQSFDFSQRQSSATSQQFHQQQHHHLPALPASSTGTATAGGGDISQQLSTRGREFSAASSEVAALNAGNRSGADSTLMLDDIDDASAMGTDTPPVFLESSTPSDAGGPLPFQSIAMYSNNTSGNTTRRNSLGANANNSTGRLETIEESSVMTSPSGGSGHRQQQVPLTRQSSGYLSAAQSPSSSSSLPPMPPPSSHSTTVAGSGTYATSANASSTVTAASSALPSPLPPYSRNDTSTSVVYQTTATKSQQQQQQQQVQQSLASSLGSNAAADAVNRTLSPYTSPYPHRLCLTSICFVFFFCRSGMERVGCSEEVHGVAKSSIADTTLGYSWN